MPPPLRRLRCTSCTSGGQPPPSRSAQGFATRSPGMSRRGRQVKVKLGNIEHRTSNREQRIHHAGKRTTWGVPRSSFVPANRKASRHADIVPIKREEAMKHKTRRSDRARPSVWVVCKTIPARAAGYAVAEGHVSAADKAILAQAKEPRQNRHVHDADKAHREPPRHAVTVAISATIL